MEAPAPKARRKRGEADDGEGRRRRKPKATVEVNSTFTELRRLLQEMRPSTLQVLRTPYYRNCKAARNMRKGVRQIRDFCKQVRLETVMLAKKKQGEELSRRRRKSDTTPPPDGGPSKNADADGPSPSHSIEHPSLSNEKRVVTVTPGEPSETSEPAKSKLLTPKPETSPAQREREVTPKREREITPKREREREITPKRDRERDRETPPRREREKSPKRDKEKSPKEREKSPKPIQKKPKVEEEVIHRDSDESE